MVKNPPAVQETCVQSLGWEDPLENGMATIMAQMGMAILALAQITPDLLPEESICRSRSNSYNWTWNNRLVPNRKRSTSRLYIVTLLI